MRNGAWIAAGVAALVIASGVGIAMSSADETKSAGTGERPTLLSGLVPEKQDCRDVATHETGFDPATASAPVREDAGNKQVLKGTAVGAAFGAVAGEVIGGKPGLGAAAGAGAGAAGGQAIKADKQSDADARYEVELASYEQRRAAYDAALQACLG